MDNKILFFKRNGDMKNNDLMVFLCSKFDLHRHVSSNEKCVFLKNNDMLIAIRKDVVDVILYTTILDNQFERYVKKTLYQLV